MSDALERLRAALADRYAIEEEVGAGGMATVYLARDLRHERNVALKVLRPDLAATLGPERFLQEVRVTANLQHPHILPLFDSGEADGFLYYVMPYLDGESLRERLDREGELPVPEAARLLRDVVDALAAAHAMGVVHRDIKPENILLTGRHAMVADFGIAKAVTEATGRHKLTTLGVALGTPSYMAPEQAAADENIDHRADIYAVGAIAYELLTGRPPFSGKTPQAILAAQVTEMPSPVTEARAAVPPGLAMLVMRCLEKKPADRWQRTEEMLPHLEAATTPSGGMTPTQLTPVELPKKPPPWKWIAGVAGVVAVAAVAFAIGQGGGPAALEDASDAGSTGAMSVTAAGTDSEPVDRLVVVPFTNRTGEPDADIWGQMAADWATRAIARHSNIEVVPGSVVQDALRGMDLTTGISVRELAEHTRALHAFSGSYSEVRGVVRFQVELSDASSGELLSSLESVEGSADSIESLVVTVADRIAAVALQFLGEESSVFARGSGAPPSVEAFRRFMAGSDAFCRSDYDQAIEHLEAVLELAPDYVSPLLTLIPSYSNAGRGTEPRRDSIISLARTLTSRMTALERALLEWLDWDDRATRMGAAEELYRLDSGAWGYGLAFAALHVNRLERARVGADDIDWDDPCNEDWAANWTLTGTVRHLTGDYEAELAISRDGRRIFPNAVRYVDWEVRALAALGRVEAVDSMVEVGFSLPPAEGFTLGLRATWASRALRRHGHAEAAQQLADKGVAWFEERPNNDRYGLARAYYYASRFEDAERLLVELREEAPNNPNYLGFYGYALERQGRRDEADAVDAELEALEANARNAIAYRAFMAGIRSDGDAVVAHLQRYLAEQGVYYTNTNLWPHDSWELEAVRDHPPLQALLRPKG